ncbi:MAG: hypothetical protein GX354_02620 [Firmicutes bacterium]|nr:hypothetical protein [Bacillota bacterium]
MQKNVRRLPFYYRARAAVVQIDVASVEQQVLMLVRKLNPRFGGDQGTRLPGLTERSVRTSLTVTTPRISSPQST